ncbi:MAG: HesA/MoeB/ThiF family protein [Flavobacteriia bacterium]|nr:HesA/MoeB/ThiF family protein [Flavobacteriia bacterium]OIP46447.1 MAG: molybdopterin biosynthesis protein MoeB [Flavobacteriaceae bacterium CG2_30_31_66]PIV96556.1 MAG: molybdopterin biosynthesis protein MoeB [Flavobacteriaceae bacterium CG17_big_fil_post_rev_8_21_14_2_50_31_13]PIX10950.1 MAG: molybdopterin biosynthesis protein MoeB [Flavobacteriaceae bacterium CG_4_8_14_3_um_filter_31_8]PIY16078.1 MAG: molybdopterin biosynthesis protein MoeB [Flavobacteriaceae bacterium CG_4_10_14_3_um_fil
MKPTKNQLFKRQISVSEIGELGQEKLQKAAVLVVGCGGLGSAIAVYLASSGIGKIHLVDFDTVDISNLHRQVFYNLSDIGKPKAAVLASFIKERAPFTDVSFYNNPVTKNTVFDLISKVDVVVDGTDSLPTKYLLNDACVLKNKSLVYGSLYKFDGYVASFNIPQQENFSANLRDAFPIMSTDIPNCEVTGTLNAIVGIIATFQVNEVLKIISEIGKPLQNELLIYNSLNNSQLKMKLTSNFTKENIQEIFDSESYFDAKCEFQNPDWLISFSELNEKLSSKNIEIIAVLPDLKLPFSVSQVIPIQDFSIEKIKIDFSKTYVMVCQKGLNSYKATSILKSHFPDLNVLSLAGGIENFQ